MLHVLAHTMKTNDVMHVSHDMCVPVSQPSLIIHDMLVCVFHVDCIWFFCVFVWLLLPLVQIY